MMTSPTVMPAEAAGPPGTTPRTVAPPCPALTATPRNAGSPSWMVLDVIRFSILVAIPSAVEMGIAYA
jgi:hypothetical protein